MKEWIVLGVCIGTVLYHAFFVWPWYDNAMKELHALPCECKGGEHLFITTYSRRRQDWFRKRYWLRCGDCDLKIGPIP